MIDSQWTRQWPDLFDGLSEAQVSSLITAIDNGVLEGWEPHREDIAFLVRSARGEFTEGDEVAEAVAMVSRRRTRHAAS
ncbi:hypothetical protein GCM10009624_28010 [Gordonia sinesedis]